MRILPERSWYKDPETGAEIVQWTNSRATDRHLYFTSYSVTVDDRWLVFVSDRDGNPNLYAIDRGGGSIRRLSDNRRGLLRSYVYPRGGRRGLSKASPCLDHVRNRVFYIRDDTVFAVDLDPADSREQAVGEIPAGWCSAYTHLSPDGEGFCVPCTDPKAFADEVPTQWEQLRRVPARMEQGGLVTQIWVINVRTGRSSILAEVPFWVTHVQYDPAGTGRIIFNREGFQEASGTPLPDRIWCLETSGHYRPLAAEAHGEWRSHENWAPDGKSILYHGGRDGRCHVASRTWEGELVHETRIDGIQFHHATGALDGRRLYVDRPNGMISILDPYNRDKPLVNLCRHDTSIEDQDAHAHPITTPGGGSLIFTSNRGGSCNVYEAFFAG